MELNQEVSKFRKVENGVDLLFVNRWSPRAMSGEAVSQDEMNTLFEAARWAPSAFNNQSWRFLYAMRESAHWDKFFDLMVDNNKSWAKNAGALLVVVSKKTFDYNGKPARTHTYDTGAAWGSLALQGTIMGLVVHGMQGFDYDRAAHLLNVSDEFTVEAMAAIGRRGNIEDLPEPTQKMEFPSERRPLSEIAIEGGF